MIEASIHAIKYFHSLSNIKIGTSSFVSHALEAAKRILLQRGGKTNPITAETLYSICGYLNKSGLLKDVRLKVIILLSFAGFLRFSECQNLKRRDIIFEQTHVMLFIEKSKTDTYRQGH